MPTNGFHSVIDSPDCVMRVAPPIPIIRITQKQQQNSQLAILE
jgi:hypothetical protein